jgi:predicted GIY-YIG superfamily endonuclease
MDERFREQVDALRPKIEALLSMKPIRVCDRVKKEVPARGVYLLSEGKKRMYVGRSNNIHARLHQHCRPSSDDNAASFAFLLAREKLGYERHQFTRKQLIAKKRFQAAFRTAKRRIRRMKLRYVQETEATPQALLEIYVSVVLKAHHNDFDTH